MKYLVYLFWITVYSRNSRIRWALDGISWGRRRFLLGLIALLMIGQLSQSTSSVYPLAYWGMYSNVDPSGPVYDYTGIRADGSEFRLPMTDLIRNHSKTFVWRLRSLAREINKAGSEAERARLETLYDDALQSAWTLYRSRALKPDEAIVAIRVRRAVVSTRDFVDVEGVQWDHYREVPL